MIHQTMRQTITWIRRAVLCMVLTLSSVAAWADRHFNDYNTQDNPYLIQSIDDWNNLAIDVENHYHYNGEYFRLTADITVNVSNGDRMIGDINDLEIFSGYFDGAGHTLTFKYLNGDGSYVAPFRHIHNAKISRLNVTGTLHTSGKFAGGIVGKASGDDNLIESCHVSTTMILDINGDASSGGLLGLISDGYYAKIEMKNCLFDGVFCSTMGINSYACGGLVGWAGDGMVCKAYNCYYNASETFPNGRKAIGTDACATFIRYRHMNDNIGNYVDNCFYSRTLGLGQGTDKGARTPDDLVYALNNFGGHSFDLWELNNNEPVPAMRVGSLTFAHIEGLKHLHYIPYGQSSVTIPYTIYDDTGHELSLQNDCDATLQKYVENSWTTVNKNKNPITISNTGHYRLIVTPYGGTVYTDEYVKEFFVYNQPADFDGYGTTDRPYLIQDAADWDKFVGYINNDRYNTCYYKLTANIAVSSIAGDETHTFNGSFDGDNHTITVSYGTSESPVSSQFAAPFAVVDGATIHDLNTTGTIYSSAKYAAGLVGMANGDTKIHDCHSSVVITSSVSGDATNGGFIGVQGSGEYTTEIRRCVFDGKLLGGSANRCGGFVGWRNMHLRIDNSIYAPAAIGGSETEVNDEGSATFSRNGVSGISNSYYTRQLGEKQGVLTQPVNSAPANIGSEDTYSSNSFLTVYENGLKYGDKYYMARAIELADDADNSELLSFCNGYMLSSVTLEGRTLYHDGDWNTLCLPFDLATLTGTPLAGATLMTLDNEGKYDNEGNLDNENGTHQTSFDSETGTLNLYFKTATSIEAGKPYIVKWISGENITNPEFTNVVIKYTSSPVTVDDVVSFYGTYGNYSFTTADERLLFLGTDNTLYYPLVGATIGAQRAYFQLQGNLTAGEPAGGASIKSFNLSFGDETTSISQIENETMRSEAVYDLSGRRISASSVSSERSVLPKGVYIVNGKKVLIK